MNLLDIPISTFDDDRFGHRKIAEALADYICDPSSKAGSVIAICGGWGTGKSGILNLLVATFQERSIIFGGEKGDPFRPIFVRFEPWLVGSREGLIASLFGQLINAISKLQDAELPLSSVERWALKEAIDELREKAIKFSELASIVSGAASGFDPTGISSGISLISGASGNLLSKMVTGKRSLERERADLVQSLNEVASLRRGLRFVVLVDDMDRLEPVEVVEVIRLVKAVAALPHVTYVLSFDKPVVEKAIKTALSVESGASFLEKVVQFYVPVPALQSRHLPDLLEKFCRDTFPDDADYSSQRALFVFRVWAGRLLTTPRDAKRLLSSIALIWPSLKGKADLLDLLWIEMLKLRASYDGKDLYSWVRSYMMSVEHVSFGGMVVGTSGDAERLREILGNLGWNCSGVEGKKAELDLHHLGAFIPGVSPNYLEVETPPTIFQLSGHDGWRSFAVEKRLGSPRHWRYYFGFSAPESAILSDEIARIMDSSRLSPTALIAALCEVLQSGGEDKRFAADQILFENLEPIIGTLRDIEASAWLEALVALAPKLDMNSAATFTPDRSNFKIRNRRLFGALLQRLSYEGRLSLFRDLMRRSTSYWVLSDFLRGEMQVHEEKESRPTAFNTERVFDEGQLRIAQMVLSSQLSEAIWEHLAVHGAPWDILFAWLDFDEAKAASWLNRQLDVTDDLFVSRLLNLVTYSYSTTRKSYFPAHYVDHFTPSDAVGKRLEEIRRTESNVSQQAGYLLSIWQAELPGSKQNKHSRAMARSLLTWEWEFVFNPRAYSETKGGSGSKRMIFREQGEIVEGKNNNEHSWRIADEFFEFLSSDGKMYSQFRFDPLARRFDHTTVAGTKSLFKDQYMIAKRRLDAG